MKEADKVIKDFFMEQSEVCVGEAKINETIERAKAAFYENEAAGFLSKLGFLYQQGRYVHKYWWVVQGVLLIGLWWILSCTDSSFYIQRSMGIAAPLFVVLILPELWKNRNSEAMEVECSTYYHLRQVYAARMLIFALVDLFMLSMFCIAASFTVQMGVCEFVIQFFIPFNVSCCICFRMLYSNKVASETFSILLCMVWAAVWVRVVLTDKVYNAISVSVWLCMFAVSVMYLCYCIVKGQRSFEKIWEEGISIWN